MRDRLAGLFYLAAGTVMSLAGIGINTLGFAASYEGLDGVYMVLPVCLAALAAIVCPITATILSATVAFYIFVWPWWMVALFFTWWILLLLYWRFSRKRGGERPDFRLYIKEAFALLQGEAKTPPTAE